VGRETPVFKGRIMETFWDWLTVLFFGSLVVLMLQRSMEENPDDKLILYLPMLAIIILMSAPH
jgi:hypothetical protein